MFGRPSIDPRRALEPSPAAKEVACPGLSANVHHRLTLPAVLVVAFLGASCSLLGGPFGGGGASAPFPIPTTKGTPTTNETLRAYMQFDGPCLYLLPIEGNTLGPTLLPIWPNGFTAVTGPRTLLLFPAPITGLGPIGPSEIMELHGQRIETPPADSEVLPECATYPLLLVGDAISLS
jgi:hypothetical protein